MGCLVCGENDGFLDSGEPCWGCNFATCKKCGLPIPYNISCVKCGFVNDYKGYDNRLVEERKNV